MGNYSVKSNEEMGLPKVACVDCPEDYLVISLVRDHEDSSKVYVEVTAYEEGNKDEESNVYMDTASIDALMAQLVTAKRAMQEANMEGLLSKNS